MNKLHEAAKEEVTRIEKEIAEAQEAFDKAVGEKKKDLRSARAIVARFEKKEAPAETK